MWIMKNLQELLSDSTKTALPTGLLENSGKQSFSLLFHIIKTTIFT